MTRKFIAKDDKAIRILEVCVDKGCTDREIQAELLKECDYEWSIPSIRRARVRFTGVKKGSANNEQDSEREPLSLPPPGMPDDEKASWFREDFKNSYLHRVLKKQLTEEEIVIYLEEYGRLCCQFEDIVISEFLQIDDFLKHRILVTRQMTKMKTIQEEIQALSVWLNNNKITSDMDADAKKEIVSQINLLSAKREELEKINNRYDKLCSEKDKMEKKLNATRKDRLEQLAGGKDTFVNLVAMLQHSQAERDRQGRYAEWTKMASEETIDEFRNPIEFPDGETDTIITDFDSVQREED